MENKVVVLTGATSGIGMEVAKTLHKEGFHLVLGNRNMEKAKRVKNQIQDSKDGGIIDLLEIDLSSFSSIKQFADEVNNTYPKIDILINNAGVFSRRYSTTAEGFEMSKGVNFIGTYYLTELLKDKMKKTPNAKIINVSSVGCYLGKLRIREGFFEKRVTSFTDYFNSKKANLIHTIELGKELAEYSTKVVAADPGIVYSKIWKWRSGFGRFLEKIQKRIMKSATEGSRIIVSLAMDDSIIDGQHVLYSSKGPRTLPKQVKNNTFRKNFMDFTQAIVSKHV